MIPGTIPFRFSLVPSHIASIYHTEVSPYTSPAVCRRHWQFFLAYQLHRGRKSFAQPDHLTTRSAPQSSTQPSTELSCLRAHLTTESHLTDDPDPPQSSAKPQRFNTSPAQKKSSTPPNPRCRHMPTDLPHSPPHGHMPHLHLQILQKPDGFLNLNPNIQMR